MAATQTLSASLEDYLEAIYRLVQAKRVARVKDIAAMLGVQMSSVTGALRSLSGKGLVDHAPYSYATLTPRGESIAREVLRRHQVLTEFLMGFLGLEPEAAERNACHMEHAIEPVVLERLTEFVEFAARCPRAGVQWVHGMAHACGEGNDTAHCEACIEECLAMVRARLAGAAGGNKDTSDEQAD